MYVVFCDRFQVWKPVLILEGRFENGCGIWHFLPGGGGGELRIWKKWGCSSSRLGVYISAFGLT